MDYADRYRSATKYEEGAIIADGAARDFAEAAERIFLFELDRQAARIAELETTAKNMHHWLWGVVFEAGGEARVSRRAMASGGPDFRLDCHKSPSSDDFVIRAALAPPTGEDQ